MGSPAPSARTTWIVAPSIHAPLSPMTITQIWPLGGAVGAGGAGSATGEVGAVGRRGPLSREHPARATITRMATPNFIANLLTPGTTAEHSIDDGGCLSHAPLGDSVDTAYGC